MERLRELAAENSTTSALIKTKGFSTVGLLITLPFLISVLASVLLFTLTLRHIHAAGSSCRKAVWQAQKAMALHLHQLVRLNPLSARLRKQRILAETKLQAARLSLNPQAILLAEIYLQSVVALQWKHRLQQQQILLQAHQSRMESLQQFQQRAHDLDLTQVHITSRESSLAVDPQPLNSLTPDYLPSPHLKDQQTLSLSYKFNLFKNGGSWTQLIWKETTPLYYEGRCGASLNSTPHHHKEIPWESVLVAVKS